MDAEIFFNQRLYSTFKTTKSTDQHGQQRKVGSQAVFFFVAENLIILLSEVKLLEQSRKVACVFLNKKQ